MFRAIKRFISLWKQVSSELKTDNVFEQAHPGESAQPLAAAPVLAVPERNVQTAPNPNGRIALPLRSILTRLTPDCMRLVRQLDVGDALVFLPTQQVLEQIPKGAVKITFLELKKASPPGVFGTETLLDKVMVDLPLQEIISRLNPALLARRSSQQQVYLPTEVTAPFGDQEKGVAPISSPVSSAPPASPKLNPFAHTNSTTIQRRSTETPVTAARGQGDSAGATPMGSAASPGFVPQSMPGLAQGDAIPVAPRQNEFNTAMISRVGTPLALSQKPSDLIAPLPDVFSMAGAAVNAAEMHPKPGSPSSPLTSVPVGEVSLISTLTLPAAAHASQAQIISPIAPQPLEEPVAIRFQFPTTPASSAVAPLPCLDGDIRTINVSIVALSGEWPEVVQQEIAFGHLGNAIVAFPFAIIQVAIKQGKVSLPWRVIRSWVKSTIPLASSPNDAAVLDLPLKVITPLFLAELKESKPQRRVVIDQNIPDLFSASKTADSKTPAPVEKSAAAANLPSPMRHSLPVPPSSSQPGAAASYPVASSAPITGDTSLLQKKVKAAQPDTNYFSKPDDEPLKNQVNPNGTKQPSLGTTFLQRYATPNEIVSKAAALEGVCGALVALPDGLLVASEIPAEMNAHTVAAFLPQMFARVGQCTKELRLGDLNNLSFTVGVVPWKIFKVGSIYFAAFGREGGRMPTSELADIAAELDRNPR